MRKNKMNKTTRNIALGLAVVSTFALYTPHAWATVAPTDMPTGGKLTAGSASGMNTNVGTATNPVQNITQSSDRAIITWDTYNLGKNGTFL